MIAQISGFTRHLLKAWNNISAEVVFSGIRDNCFCKARGRICQSAGKWGLVVLIFGMVPPALSDEPAIDGNVNLAWWSNNFSATAIDPSFDAGTVGGEAEVWWQHRWGLKGSLFKSDIVESNSQDGPDFLSIDIKRRVVSASKNNFLALGLGWESIDLGGGGDTQGPRLVVQGSLGLTPVLSVYGHTAWLPALEESQRMSDPDGFELEAGIKVKPFPFLSFRAGYRQFQLDFKSLEGANEASKSKGVIIGAGVDF